MEILIDDIPEEGLTIHANTKADGWLKSVVKGAVGQRFSDEDKADLSVTLIKYEENVDITGKLNIFSHPQCDRCLKPYKDEEAVPFHVLLAPLYESRRQKEEEEEGGFEKELVREDLEFSYYEGDRVDLDDILREQILLAEPFKHICKTDCKGICQKCGKDLNEGPCNCKEEHHDKRWEVLKDFKPAKKKRVTKR